MRGLKAPPRERRGAGRLAGLGRGDQLLLGFDGTGPGDDADVLAADGQAADADDGGLCLGFATGDLVGRQDRQDLGHARRLLRAILSSRRLSGPIAATTVRSTPLSTWGFKPRLATRWTMCSTCSAVAFLFMTTITSRLLCAV